MIAILTSSLGGSHKVDGKWLPTYLLNQNGLTGIIKSYWKSGAKVLIICASPDEYERNDSVLYCMKEAFAMSGLDAVSFDMCDDRNMQVVEQFYSYDAVILAGGHVPTQNDFFKEINLKEKLNGYEGILIGWSAGSMNCADVVYAQPELEGEGKNPEYQRFITGLGVTKTMIIPHFQAVKNDIVDGLRAIEDIAYPDSMGREFVALNDGSFIVCDNGVETLYGEAYLIKDGSETLLCKNEETKTL